MFSTNTLIDLYNCSWVLLSTQLAVHLYVTLQWAMVAFWHIALCKVTRGKTSCKSKQLALEAGNSIEVTFHDAPAPFSATSLQWVLEQTTLSSYKSNYKKWKRFFTLWPLHLEDPGAVVTYSLRTFRLPVNYISFHLLFLTAAAAERGYAGL